MGGVWEVVARCIAEQMKADGVTFGQESVTWRTNGEEPYEEVA